MKDKIPRALKEQVWLSYNGKVYEAKCHVRWCKNTITVFDFHCGHNVPESKGGATDISNLLPICSRCNLSMGDDYTIEEWTKLSEPLSSWKLFWRKVFSCIKCGKRSDTKENGTQSIPNPMSQRNKHFKFHGLLSNIKSHPKTRTASGSRKKKKT